MPKIPRGQVTIENFNDVVQQMIAGKSDREVGILAGAFLEGLLFDYLKSKIVDSPLQKAEALFEYPRPLSAFGGMISLGFAFGMISMGEYINLQVVKNVRNFCAHSLGLADRDKVDFASEPIRKLLREFTPKVLLKDLPKEQCKKVTEPIEKLVVVSD